MAPKSLVSRVILFNTGAFLAVALAVFSAIDRYQESSLRRQTDRELETAVLVFASEFEALFASRDAERWRAALDLFSRAHGIGHSFFRALDGEGAEIAASDLTHWPGAGDRIPPWRELRDAPFAWQTLDLGAEGARLIYYRDPGGVTLQIGFSLREQRAALHRSRTLFGVGLLTLLALGALLGWLATRHALVGLRRVTEAAAHIRAHGDLNRRAPLDTGSLETNELARTLNAMLDRLNQSILRLREVMRHIAHDVKTPVARMRVMAERRMALDEGDQELAGNVVEECDHIMNLISNLLEITKAESGLAQWTVETVDLAALIRDAVDLFDPILENKRQTLDVAAPESLTVDTDRRALQRVIANLLDNAIKYTPAGGRIEATLAPADDGGAVMTFADNGPGVPPAERERVFLPFYRGDESRSEPGNGLGLSFCRATLRALGGFIRCEAAPGGGARFQVGLPSAPPPNPNALT